ncbi:very short patch repair endonuclease [Pseudomonas syringae]|uniref:very short patch repair endonuclease n=1 Tax=Pseudomonas syringae TaxID=317 RepID=UPI003204FA89
MANIQGRDTQPELKIRKILHAAGYRFRLHYRRLPGKPDIVLPRYRLCIFVHGCFWHRHAGCKYTTFPKTRVDFWEKKFNDTVVRDEKNVSSLLEKGWRVFELWECGLKNPTLDLMNIIDQIPATSKIHLVWPSY